MQPGTFDALTSSEKQFKFQLGPFTNPSAAKNISENFTLNTYDQYNYKMDEQQGYAAFVCQ